MKKSLVLVAAACALLAISSPAFAASPAAAYRARVNAICKVGVAKINAVAQPSSPKGYATYFDTEARLGYQLMQEIIAVKPPKSLQPLVLAGLRPEGKVVDLLLTMRDRIRKGADPVKTANAAGPTLTGLTDQANTAWRKAGLNACAG